MNRIVLWVMSTITVMVLLFGYHTSTSGPEQALAVQESAPIAGSTADNSAASAGSATSSSSSGSGTAAANGNTVDGDSVDTEWGPVQVQITVAGGEITAVKMLDYPYESRKDQEINARALPILIQETLDQQSADIDMVSGATITSEGYRESLQSALDQAGL